MVPVEMTAFAFLVVVAAAFQLVALPRLLGLLGATVTARLLLAVTLCSAAFVGTSMEIFNRLMLFQSWI